MEGYEEEDRAGLMTGPFWWIKKEGWAVGGSEEGARLFGAY